jgi:hypothetical protein
MTRILGFNDEITVCDHCGKRDLCGTYAVEEDNGILRYGSVCIGHVYGKRQGKALTARAHLIDKIRQTHNRSAYAAQYLGWATSKGWIVDGLGHKVIEAA